MLVGADHSSPVCSFDLADPLPYLFFPNLYIGTVVLDASAARLALCRPDPSPEAGRAFAMGRHAVLDLAQIFAVRTDAPPERLTPADYEQLRDCLRSAGLDVLDDAAADAALTRLRALYEPSLAGLAAYLMMPLPAWIEECAPDDVEPWRLNPRDISTRLVPDKR